MFSKVSQWSFSLGVIPQLANQANGITARGEPFHIESGNQQSAGNSVLPSCKGEAWSLEFASFAFMLSASSICHWDDLQKPTRPTSSNPPDIINIGLFGLAYWRIEEIRKTMKDFDLIISNLPTSANYKVEELAKQGFLAERGGCFRGFGHPGRSLGLLHPSVFCLVFV